MSKQSRNYERAKAMVMSDKFNMRQTDFFDELRALVARHTEFDAMEVHTELGASESLVITISVKKVKGTLRPLS